MPGPRFPQGYKKVYHDIAAKLIAEQPERLQVTIPGVQCAYARSTFNYFRQSYLRYFDFLQKQKDFDAAKRAMDIYNRLASYSVQISPPFSLILTSKNIDIEVTMESTGRLEVEFSQWLPQMEDHKQSANQHSKRGPLKLKDRSNLPTEFDVQMGLKRQEQLVQEFFGNKTSNSAPVIPDNPPTTAPFGSEADNLAFLLTIGRAPATPQELETWLKTGQLE